MPLSRRLLLVFALLGAARAARADEVVTCATAAEDAQAQRAAGRLSEAQASLTRCSRESCPIVVRKDCIRWLDEVTSALPTIIVHATNAAGSDLQSVRVSIDGRVVSVSLDGRPIALDPGQHRARFESAGFAPITRDLVLAEAQKNRMIEVRFEAPSEKPAIPPKPEEAPSPVLPWILVAGGAAALTTFGVLEIVAQGEYRDLRDGCGQTRACSADAVSPTRTKFVIAGVALAAGMIATGMGVTLLVLHSSKASEPRAALRASAGFVSVDASF
jgi:hypothetical protein